MVRPELYADMRGRVARLLQANFWGPFNHGFTRMSTDLTIIFEGLSSKTYPCLSVKSVVAFLQNQSNSLFIIASATLRAIFLSFDRTEGAHYTGCKTTREAGP